MRRLLLTLFLFAAPLAGGEITPESVVRLMNAERAERGLAPLRADVRLAGAAAARMTHMEEEQFWAHNAPDGTPPFVWIAPNGYRFAAAGENLARGFENAELLVASWMESPGHRANILGNAFIDCGIAVIDGYTTGPGAGKSIVVLFASERH